MDTWTKADTCSLGELLKAQLQANADRQATFVGPLPLEEDEGDQYDPYDIGYAFDD